MLRHPASRSQTPPFLLRTLLATVALLSTAAVAAVAQPEPPLSPAELEQRNRAIKRALIQKLWEDAWPERYVKGREAAVVDRRALGAPRHSRAPGPASRGPAGFGVSGALAIPTNLRVNDPVGDAADATQSEESIAAWTSYVLVAWNDGQGLVTGGDKMGYGYSTDGGASFVDGGDIPKLAGWRWITDPVVTVNEKTGEFYFCGVVNPSVSTNGIGVVRATFSGSVISWDTPRLVVSFNSATDLADKPWIAADSVSGNLYLAYTHFVGGVDSIVFRRSTDDGATWGPMLTLSSSTAAGRVQGARPAVGPAGELYVVWSELGLVDTDYFRVRKSVDQGVSFGPQATVGSFYANSGTGAPGFNRERGITYPSIAVDRTFGLYRGRVYVAWNESANWYNDALGAAGSKTEVENNDFYLGATPFTPGQRLRGSFASEGDLDHFAFTVTQGATCIFWCDSVPNPLYAMRIVCGQDTSTQLAYSGDLKTPAGGSSFIVWTAPSEGTYYLRMGYVTGGSLGGYRIRTGLNSFGPEVGRDQRDVIVKRSDDGVIWMPAVRVNDDLPYYENWLPEVAVGADGSPYVTWFDWRDDACGGQSYQYASRSEDGGATWHPNQRFSDVQNAWTTILSNLVPNQGDYNGAYADERHVRPTWADGRDGSPDVYATSIDTWFDLTACPDDTTAGEFDTVNVAWTGLNFNPLFSGTYEYFLTDTRGWPLPSLQTVTAPAGSDFGVPFTLEVPDTAAGGINTLCLTVRNLAHTRSLQCCFDVSLLDVIAVGEPPMEFALDPTVPNPASGSVRISFRLARAGPAGLDIYGLRGERVRTLVHDIRAAGPHMVTWDGRDDEGRRVPAGVYFYRLESDGRSARRHLVWLH
jgi:hypothetical protein